MLTFERDPAYVAAPWIPLEVWLARRGIAYLWRALGPVMLSVMCVAARPQGPCYNGLSHVAL